MHIDKNDLIEFDNGTMSTQQIIELLSHLDHCDSCLDQMIEQESHNSVTVLLSDRTDYEQNRIQRSSVCTGCK